MIVLLTFIGGIAFGVVIALAIKEPDAPNKRKPKKPELDVFDDDYSDRALNK